MSRLVFPNYFLIWIGSAVKNETEHREREGGEKDLGHEVTFDVSVGHDLFKSKYDELSVGRTLWVFKRVALISIAVYTGYVCEGFELSSSGSVIANAGFIKQFGDGKANGVRALNPSWVSAWSAFLNVGQILTFTYIPWFADTFGRKKSFYVAWAWLVVGCILLNTAKSPGVWLVAKLCNGAGVGVLQITCQVYVMEICPNNISGGMVTFQLLWSNIGSIIISAMMQQLNQKHPDNYLLAMRILWAPIALMIVCWFFVPESPWFHARHNNKEKAIAAMKTLYGGVPGYDYENEYAIITRTIAHERAQLQDRPLYIDVFRGVNRKRTLTVMLTSVASQFGGLAIVNTYSTYFFSFEGPVPRVAHCLVLQPARHHLLVPHDGRAGSSPDDQHVPDLHVRGALPRRRSVLDWRIQRERRGGQGSPGRLLSLVFCLYNRRTVPLSLLGRTSVCPPPHQDRPRHLLANSLLGIATTFATPPMLLALNLKSGFVFGAFSVPIMILMWFYLPETKGRSAAEIDELFERKIPAWRWSKTVTSVEENTHAAVHEKGGVEEVQDA